MTPGEYRLENIRQAIRLLKQARLFLRDGKAPRARAYVSRALKSAEGAERHAMRGDIIAKETK